MGTEKQCKNKVFCLGNPTVVTNKENCVKYFILLGPWASGTRREGFALQILQRTSVHQSLLRKMSPHIVGVCIVNLILFRFCLLQRSS